MEAKAFIGLCVYYWAWIKDFSIIAEPIFCLFHRGHELAGTDEGSKPGKGKNFDWAMEQERAMDQLKQALVSTPALKMLVYQPEEDGFVGQIVLGVDTYGLGFG